MYRSQVTSHHFHSALLDQIFQGCLSRLTHHTPPTHTHTYARTHANWKKCDHHATRWDQNFCWLRDRCKRARRWYKGVVAEAQSNTCHRSTYSSVDSTLCAIWLEGLFYFCSELYRWPAPKRPSTVLFPRTYLKGEFQFLDGCCVAQNYHRPLWERSHLALDVFMLDVLPL